MQMSLRRSQAQRSEHMCLLALCPQHVLIAIDARCHQWLLQSSRSYGSGWLVLAGAMKPVGRPVAEVVFEPKRF
jgi:hypothetical protein